MNRSHFTPADGRWPAFFKYLENKYKNCDQTSDIVDLNTLTVVEDRGHLRGMRPYTFGDAVHVPSKCDENAVKWQEYRNNPKLADELKKNTRLRKTFNISMAAIKDSNNRMRMEAMIIPQELQESAQPQQVNAAAGHGVVAVVSPPKPVFARSEQKRPSLLQDNAAVFDVQRADDELNEDARSQVSGFGQVPQNYVAQVVPRPIHTQPMIFQLNEETMRLISNAYLTRQGTTVQHFTLTMERRISHGRLSSAPAVLEASSVASPSRRVAARELTGLMTYHSMAELCSPNTMLRPRKSVSADTQASPAVGHCRVYLALPAAEAGSRQRPTTSASAPNVLNDRAQSRRLPASTPSKPVSTSKGTPAKTGSSKQAPVRLAMTNSLTTTPAPLAAVSPRRSKRLKAADENASPLAKSTSKESQSSKKAPSRPPKSADKRALTDPKQPARSKRARLNQTQALQRTAAGADLEDGVVPDDSCSTVAGRLDTSAALMDTSINSSVAASDVEQRVLNWVKAADSTVGDPVKEYEAEDRKVRQLHARAQRRNTQLKGGNFYA